MPRRTTQAKHPRSLTAIYGHRDRMQSYCVCKRLGLDVVYSKRRERETGTHEEKEEEKERKEMAFDRPGEDQITLESRIHI